MTQEPDIRYDSLIPRQPIPEGAHEFSKRVHGLLDGKPKDEATVEKALQGMDGMFDLIAAGLYNLASMLVGEGEESIQLVETAIATAEISVCSNPEQARRSSRKALCIAALNRLAGRDPASLVAPVASAHVETCIDDEELDAASHAELENMIAGPGRERVRKWLTSLSAPQRVAFVLRAVGGFTTLETANLVTAHGGPRAAGWTAGTVRECFRQALCSLASQLIHATTAR